MTNEIDIYNCVYENDTVEITKKHTKNTKDPIIGAQYTVFSF